MEKVYKVLTKISEVLAKASFVLLMIGMLYICADIASRVIFTKSFKGDYELTQLWLCLLSFSCVAFIQSKKGHVNVIILIRRLRPAAAMACLAVTHVISTVMCGAVAFSAVRLALQALAKHDVTAMLHIPTYPFFLYEGFCMGLLCLMFVIDTIKCFLAIRNKKYADEIMNTWV